MYTPAHFNEIDRATIADLVRNNSFATLASSFEGEVEIVHLPLLLNQDGEDWILTGHLARANPFWSKADGGSVTAIFLGPHGYISPRWYTSAENVPTWNYAAVHLTGKFNVVTDEAQSLNAFRTLIEASEASLPEPWSMDELSDKYFQGLIRGTVSFAISVESISAKSKMSQNKPVEDREGIIERLEGSGGLAGDELAEYMKRILNL